MQVITHQDIDNFNDDQSIIENQNNNDILNTSFLDFIELNSAVPQPLTATSPNKSRASSLLKKFNSVKPQIKQRRGSTNSDTFFHRSETYDGNWGGKKSHKNN